MDDQLLMRNIVGGDRNAFDRLTVKYYPSLCLFAEHILNRESLAQDAVQEAFVYLWEKRRKLDHVSSVKNYLYTTVRHNCLAYLRSERSREKAFGKIPTQDDDIVSRYIEVETMRNLTAAIEHLPPRTGEVIRLSLEGIKQEGIAELMRITVATVKALKSDGIKKLRGIMGHVVILVAIYIFQRIL